MATYAAATGPTAAGGLVGREAECGVLVELLDGARRGRSGALVLYGEPGIGKTALLEQTVARADEMQVLRATGLEAASGLAFAGLGNLLRPALGLLTRIPETQRTALSSALGLAPAIGAQPHAVAAGTLSLLATVAETEPVLCVVDDAHWVDRESVDTLLLVASRLDAEGIVMLLAAREGEDFEATGVRDLRLAGLGGDAARKLLTQYAPQNLTTEVATRLVEQTRGNPLALLELPSLLTEAQFAGRDPLDDPLPVGGALEQAFLQRTRALPSESQRALVVAAASDSDDLGLVIRAGNALGLEAAALEPADAAKLISIRGWRFRFRHPLVRSAVYQAAPLAERRAAHGALAGVLEEAGEADRRAWHRAAAAFGPDEEVAAELEGAAASARRRGGVTAEARTLALAARLAPGNDARASRLVKAASAAWQAGSSAEATRLLDEALPLIRDPVLHADAQELRAAMLKRQGDAERAHDLLLEEAGRIESIDRHRAARMLTQASHLYFRRDQVKPALELAERAWKLAGEEIAHADLELAGTLAWARAFLGQTEAARSLALQCAEISERTGETANGPQIGWCLSWLEEHDAARALIERAARTHRAAGAFGDLAYVLFHVADLEYRSGRLPAAYAAAHEAVQLAEQTGREQLVMANLTVLAAVEAVLGRAGAARTHATHALALAGATLNLTFVARANAALGLLELSLGRPQETLGHLEVVERTMARSDIVEPSFVEWMPDLIEAYIRIDRVDEAIPRLEHWERCGRQTQRRWALAAAARYRGLLAGDDRVDRCFADAFAFHDQTPSAFERARTHLCYGERLRRAGRRVDARRELRAAFAAFNRLGAVPWAERARAELAATGETARRSDPTPAERLTPQELQVAVAVGKGRTNREVAAALFLSPKTIEYHLGNVYRKLDVRTRAQLTHRLAREGLLGDGVAA
jgi:DNA-binding CsgD family transcriptional regulator